MNKLISALLENKIKRNENEAQRSLYEKLVAYLMFIGKVATVAFLIIIIIIVKNAILKDNNKLEIREITDKLSTDENIISIADVERELRAMGQFVSAEQKYSGTAYMKDYRQIGSWDIPLTSHEISVSYTGKIKVGYEVGEIKVNVKDKVIELTIPDAKVLDNYITEYSTDESNNIFNPISSEEVNNMLKEIVENEYIKAEANGIYTMAKSNMKYMISDVLGKFDGYIVTYN